MLSKGKIWELIKPNRPVLKTDKVLHAISCYNQFCFKYIRDSIDIKLQVVFGPEITQDWVDQKLKTMDLFGGVDNFLIHFAEGIDPQVFEQFLKPEDLLLDNRHIIFNFSKESKLFAKFTGSDDVDGIQVLAPAFWEEKELLRFLGSHKGVYLSFDAEQFFCERVPFDIGKYSDLLDTLSLMTEAQSEVSVEMIKQVLVESKFDQFKLAELFGAKKMVPFYRELIELVEQNQDCYGFLYFMHNHMQKVFDPSYTEGKKRLSKYDKQILHQQKLWGPEQSARAANYFNDLLTLYKINKDDFLGRLKQDYLKTLIP